MKKLFLTLTFSLVMCQTIFANYSFTLKDNKNEKIVSYVNEINSTSHTGDTIINDMVMTQDEKNYYIDYDIDVKDTTLTMDLNEVLTFDDVSSFNLTKTRDSFSGSFVITNTEDSDFTFNTSETKDKTTNTTYYKGNATANNESKSYDITWVYNNVFDFNLLKYDYNNAIENVVIGVDFDSTIKNSGYDDNKFAPTIHPDKSYGKFFLNMGGSITQNATQKSSDYFYYNYKGKITIPKTIEKQCKYLTLYNPKAYKSKMSVNLSDGVDIKVEYISLKTLSIDLTDFYTCGTTIKDNVKTKGHGHKLTYTNNTNSKNHEKYCSVCKMLVKENHNLQYEYDGIFNNACECGYISKVNYHFLINDDYIAEINKTYNTFSNYIKYEYKQKKGYKFLGYEKYEKQYEDESNINLSETKTKIKNVFIATTSILTDKTGLYSTTYIANYVPITYKIYLSNENNQGLNLTNYDKYININPSSSDTATCLEDVNDYEFLGYSRNKNDNATIKINDSLNYLTTTIDSTIILYPVYRKISKVKTSLFGSSGGSGNRGGSIPVNDKLFGNSPTENVSVSIDKIPKVDVVINNADNLNDISNIENDINTSLTSLGVDTSDILYYTKNVERYNFNDYLDKGKEDENLSNFGVATPSVVATFSNISYNETTLEKLMLEDIEPDNIEHTCSFVSTYNDEYHWQYCTICGESAELLATLKGNNISKPTDNGNNAKGNINIEAHGTGGWVNSFVLPNYWNICNSDNEQKTCKCGATKVLHYNKKRGGNPTGYCSPYNANGGSRDGQLNNFVYNNHSTCKYCGCWSGGDGNHCYSSTKHGGGSVFNGKCICGQNSFEFKDLKVNYDTGSEIQYFLIIKHNGTYRSPFTNVFTQEDWNSGDNMRYKSFSYESLGDYTYKYIITYTYSSCITTSGYQSTQIGLYNANLQASFYPIYNDIDVRPKGELEPPVINSAEFSGLSINTDENGNDWIGQRTFTISGTENGNGAKITIKDDSGRIYYQGGMAKSGNNISLSVIPAIEANVRKTLHIIVEDLSGNKATKDIYIDNTDCKSPEIISELNYKENWKNKIIFKAEAYEGGVGLTQIALNKNSDFKFVDKIENPDNSGNDIYYRFYVFEGDVYGDDVITPTLFARDGLNHLDSKKILIGKLDSTKPTIENINISNNQIEIIANDNHITKGEGSGIKAFSVVPIGKNPTLSSFIFTNNIQIDYSGDYDVYALDNAGNVSNKYPINILIDDDATNRLRDDAIKVFNYIDNDINDIFKNESYIANNISLFDGNFIWLTNDNKDFYKNYISCVDGNIEEDYTHYKDNSTDYNNAVINTAKYIKKLIDNDYNGNYYLLGDKFNINVNPNEKRFNQTSTEYPDGMYYINHDYLHFDNSIGECNNTNKYIKDLNCDFDKVGKFDIKYCDEIMCDLYIHRKAYTNFTIQNNGGILSFTSNSFDLDDNNDIGFGKGIKEEYWYWKYPTDTSWNNGKPNTYENNKIVLVKLEIKDNQNYKTKLIKVLGLNNTFALFNIEKQKVNKGGNIKAFDNSYDSGCYAINKWNYELKKGGTFIASSSQANPIFNTTGLTLGTYILYLQVENEVGDKSNTYSKQLAIVEDLDNPFLIASPSSCSWTKKQQIDIELIDLDAGIKHYKYAFSTSKTLATSGFSSNITKDKDTIYTPNLTGKYYLSIIAEDNNGNTMQKVVGAYHIDNSCPTIASFSCVKKGANNTELIIYANDTGSGIKNFYITKIPLATNSNVEHLFTDTNVKTITSKGHYYLYVIDKVGNFEWDLSKGNVYEIASIDVDSPYVPVPSSSGGGSSESWWYPENPPQEINDFIIPDIPIIPKKPFKKKKDIVDLFNEIYNSFSNNNDLKSYRKYDIVDLINDIFSSFKKDNNID